MGGAGGARGGVGGGSRAGAGGRRGASAEDRLLAAQGAAAVAAGLNHPTNREGKEAGGVQSWTQPGPGLWGPAHCAPAALRLASVGAALRLEHGDLLGAQVGEAHATH